MLTVGIDIGSRSSKAIVLRDTEILASTILQSSMKVMDRGKAVFNDVLKKAHLRAREVDYIIATGYGRVSAPFAHKTVTEISCHGKGIHSLCPSVRTVIDIGGQDSKVIKVNEAGEVVDFAMNDRCAAGTGKFLEVTSKAMGLNLDIFARRFFESKTPCRISSMCTVFAESEVISLLAGGNKSQDIVAGLIQAVCRRVGNMAKRLKVEPEIAFTGGVAKNAGVKAALAEEVGREFVAFEFDPQLIGAYGAAIIARNQGSAKRAGGAPPAAKKKLTCLDKLNRMLDTRPAQIKAAKEKGQKTVGYFCAYVPPEIIYAAGMIPLRLNRGGDVEVSAAGNNYLSSSSCPYVCSCVGFKEKGRDFYFNAVDFVADAPSCLQMKRVLEVWEKYFGTRVIHVGFSRKYYTREGRDFYLASIRHFIEELEEIGGREISRGDLEKSVELFNAVRAYQRRLYQALRNTELAWSDLIKFIWAGNLLDKREYLDLLKELLDEVSGRPQKPDGAVNILVTGGMLAHGDEKLIKIMDDLGMDFAMDELCAGSRMTYIDITNPAAENIAAAYLSNIPCGSLPYPEEETDPRYKHLKRLIKEYRIRGVVYYTLRFCDAYSFKLKGVKAFLEKLGIPVLHLHSDYSLADEGQLKTRVEAFRETLLKKEPSP